MARKTTVDCDLCGQRVLLEQAKEAMFETGQNTYHLMDLCRDCLDNQLQAAESVNDTSGYRQKAAALIRLPGSALPVRPRTTDVSAPRSGSPDPKRP